MQIEGITHDPAVMGGKPCVAGTRVTVSTILGQLAVGVSQAQLLRDYPCLTRDNIRAALRYAAWTSTEEESELKVPARLPA